MLGRSGTGKSWLLINLILQDIRHGHAVVFLDPHGNAIDELMRRPVFDDDRRCADYILFDPESKTHSFGINLLACRNIADLNERQDTYTRAKGVFDKIWKTAYYESPWLQEIIQYTLYAFIENQDYTLGDVPLFLTDKAFRNHIVGNMRYNRHAIDFWRNRFEEKRGGAALTRVDALLGDPYVRAIVSQRRTTLDFSKIIEDRRIALIRLSDRLPTEIKTFIGTIIVSELVHTIKKRSTEKPRQFCVFVDEFQNFSSYEDFSILITEGRKYGVATTVAHQERFGQFAEDKNILGATDAAGNKVFFQLSVRDAQEVALEFAKPPPTKTEREQEMVVSQTPVFDLLNRGHKNPQIQTFVEKYLLPLQEKQEDTKEEIEGSRLVKMDYLDEAAAHRLSDRMMGVSSRSAAQAQLRALERASGAMDLAGRATDQLIKLHQEQSARRILIRDFNKFFRGVMERKLGDGCEEFSDFLIARAHEVSMVAQRYVTIFDLYISLKYGDRQKERLIPVEFARTQKLLPRYVERLASETEAKAIQERDDYLKAERERNDRWARETAEKRKRERQEQAERVWKELSEWKIDLRDFRACHVEPKRLLSEYVRLLACPCAEDILRPYYNARLASPWREEVADCTKTRVKIVEELKRLREYNEYKRKYKRNYEREHSKWFSSAIDYSSYSEYEYGPYIQDFVLDSFEKWLETYGEGAFVALMLIRLAESPEAWISRKSMPDKQKNESGYDWERRRRYPGYNMLFVPLLVNCQPLEIFLSLVKLGRAISVLDEEESLARYCAKYYWVGDGVNAYEGKMKRDIHEYNASVVHYNFGKTFGEWVLEQTCYDYVGSSTSTSEERLQCLRELKEEEWKDSESVGTHSEAVVDSAMLAYGEHKDVVATYIERRACDMSLYGEKVANRTFPLPTLKGATAGQVSEVVDGLAMLLERRRKQKEKGEQDTQCEKMEEEVYRTGAEWFTKHSITMPDNLHPMLLSDCEREMVIDACERTLLQNECGGAKKVIDEFVKICELLSRVENHILVPSGQYVTREVNARAEQDMTNEMARELVGLPSFIAYAKVLQEHGGVEEVWKGKIQTLKLEPLAEGEGAEERRDEIGRRSVSYLKRREEIEEETRLRQEGWRRKSVDGAPSSVSEGNGGAGGSPKAPVVGREEPPPVSHR